MAATVVLSQARYLASAATALEHYQPRDPFPNDSRGSAGVDVNTITVATTSLDEVGDVVLFLPVPMNARICAVLGTNADLDSNGTPALVANVICRTLDSSGTATDQNLGTLTTKLQATSSDNAWLFCPDYVVPQNASGYGHIGIKVTTPAATAAAGAVKLTVLYQ
jgi:hypothetical protein